MGTTVNCNLENVSNGVTLSRIEREGILHEISYVFVVNLLSYHIIEYARERGKRSENAIYILE